MPPTEEDPFAEHTAEANTCILWHTSSLDAERVFRKLYLILGLCSSHGPGLSEASDAKLFRVYLHLLVQDILDFQMPGGRKQKVSERLKTFCFMNLCHRWKAC